jgi:hypothetical protein
MFGGIQIKQLGCKGIYLKLKDFAAQPKMVSLWFFNLGIEQHDFGIPSSQCYNFNSTFGSRYNRIFQNSVRRNFCSEFYHIMMMQH